jgi:acid phosphatase (class A)
MNRRSLPLLLVLTALLLLPRLQGAGQPGYLPAGSPDSIALLPPPPATGTAEAAADLATTRTVSQARTSEQKAEAAAEIKLTIFCFSSAIGPWFQPGRFPKTEAFFRQIDSDTRAVTDIGKSFFQRPRPYAVDPTIVPLTREESFSYPSGHATRSTVFALVLAELFPARREALLRQGRDIGWNRIVAGVHYPADVFSGRVLGQALARAMLGNPAFQRDLAETKTEVAAVQPQ